ncbi:MAG: galactose-1-phosphate uridylyltransferase, partial [Actinobacteria bacterium]|nr:galactose-1-phosphate uridylyltransferase [Actinomycetota bacterium]
VRQVYVFENRGRDIGVTLHHPHGQIYAYPFVTPRTRRLLQSIDDYGPDLMADILAFEQNSSRVLIKGEHFTVFVPFAARWPVEVHMLPHRHVPDLAATTGPEREETAYLYRRIVQAVDLLYDTPTAYIGAWHQAPVRECRDTVRLMLQVTSPRRAANKLKYLAGSETGMGAFIGDISPEDSAERIRAALSAIPG